MEEQQRNISKRVYSLSCSPVSSTGSENSSRLIIDVANDLNGVHNLLNTDKSEEKFDKVSKTVPPIELQDQNEERTPKAKDQKDPQQFIPWSTITESYSTFNTVICDKCLKFVQLDDIAEHQQQHINAGHVPASTPSPILHLNSTQTNGTSFEVNMLSQLGHNSSQSGVQSLADSNPLVRGWNPYTKTLPSINTNYSNPNFSTLTRMPSTRALVNGKEMKNHLTHNASLTPLTMHGPVKTQSQHANQVQGYHHYRYPNGTSYSFESSVTTNTKPGSFGANFGSPSCHLSCDIHPNKDTGYWSGLTHQQSGRYSNRYQRLDPNYHHNESLNGPFSSAFDVPTIPKKNETSISSRNRTTNAWNSTSVTHNNNQRQSLVRNQETDDCNVEMLTSVEIQTDKKKEDQRNKIIQKAALPGDFVNYNIGGLKNSNKPSSSVKTTQGTQSNGPTIGRQTFSTTAVYSTGQSEENQFQAPQAASPISILFRCVYCQMFFPSFYALMQHEKERQMLVIYQRLGNYRCKFCMQGFQYAQGLLQHELDRQIRIASQPPGIFSCSFCLKALGSAQDLSNHEKEFHSVFRPEESRHCYIVGCGPDSKWASWVHNPSHH